MKTHVLLLLYLFLNDKPLQITQIPLKLCISRNALFIFFFLFVGQGPVIQLIKCHFKFTVAESPEYI